MAVIIEANYSKKIGLPAYSSHAYSVTIRSEVADLNQIESESAKLYAILQGSVDREIQEVGFVPKNNSHGSAASRSNQSCSRPANGEKGTGAAPESPFCKSGYVRQLMALSGEACHSQQSQEGMLVVRASIRLTFDPLRCPRGIFG
jgi:hypothetical protein